MLHFHSMFSLQLIALVAGAALLIMIKNQNKIKSMWLSFVAWFVIIASALSIICSIYFVVSFWNKGYGQGSMMMNKNEMMQKNEEMMNKEK